MYWRAITRLDAQESLVKLRIAAYPHLSQTDANDLHRDLHDVAFPPEKRALTPEEAMRFMNGG